MGIEFFERHGFAVPWWMSVSGEVAEVDIPVKDVIISENIAEPPCVDDSEGQGSKLISAISTAFFAMTLFIAKLFSLLSNKKKAKNRSDLTISNIKDENELEFCNFIGSSSLPHTADGKRLLNANVFFTYLENLDFVSGHYSVYAGSDISNTHNKARAIDLENGIKSSQPSMESLVEATSGFGVTSRKPLYFDTVSSLKAYMHKYMFALTELAGIREFGTTCDIVSATPDGSPDRLAIAYGFDGGSVYCMIPSQNGMFISISWEIFEKIFMQGVILK